MSYSGVINRAVTKASQMSKTLRRGGVAAPPPNPKTRQSLNANQMEIARQLGITPEQYAKGLSDFNAGNGTMGNVTPNSTPYDAYPRTLAGVPGIDPDVPLVEGALIPDDYGMINWWDE